MRVSINQPGAKTFVLREVDASGKKVFQRSIGGPASYVKTISTDGWQSGVYYLQVIAGGKT